MNPMVDMKAITKGFSGISVLNNVDLAVLPGEVMALMGENGAGKSTLMKILCGVYEPDAGEIIIDGKSEKVGSPRKAYDLGIRIVHQELSLVNHLTVSENIFLGQEPSRVGFINHNKMFRLAQDIIDKDGFNLNAKEKVGNLSIANKQLVEIAKATLGEAKILVLDEPTSALSKTEIERLFKIIYSLKGKGVSIIYISHKLNEIVRIADRIVVMKDGRNSGESLIQDVTEEKIIQMMVGREVQYVYSKQVKDNAQTIVKVENLENDVLRDINFSLREGEILGVSGLMGSGRTELLETLFGQRKADRGSILLDDKTVNIRSPIEAIKNGFAFATEDRKGNGLVLTLSVKHNNALPNINSFSRFGFINDSKRIKNAQESIQQFNVKTVSVNEKIQNLSGGNQQKVVLSKWVNMNPRIFLIDEPTRGIDVGAKAEIYQLLKKLTTQGISIIMVSSELPEILALSDRVMVMRNGRVSGILDRSEATEESIMLLATKGER
jgi:ABC-type sugar transport system ATPase subunit